MGGWYRVGVGGSYRVGVGGWYRVGVGGWNRVGVGGFYMVEVVVSVDMQLCMDALVNAFVRLLFKIMYIFTMHVHISSNYFKIVYITP